MPSDRERLGGAQYARSRWEQFQISSFPEVGYYVVTLNDQHQFDGQTLPLAIKAAADFTEQREQQIREKREEIKWLKDNHPSGSVRNRVIATLEQKLAELQRGMRNQKGWKG